MAIQKAIREIPVIVSSGGLYNTVPPEEVYSSELQHFSSSSNFLVNRAGKIYSPFGTLSAEVELFSTEEQEGIHSLWYSKSGTLYYVNDSVLYTKGGIVVTTLLQNAKVSYLDIFNGYEWVTYFTSISNTGKLVNGIYFEWSNTVYYVDYITYSDAPPKGHFIDYCGGRILIASTSDIYYSAPFHLNNFSFDEAIPGDGDIKTLSVIGQYIIYSDSIGIHLTTLSGEYKLLTNSLSLIGKPSLIKFKEYLVSVIPTYDGIYYCSPEICINVTEAKIDLKTAFEDFINYNYFSSYVENEIVHFSFF